MWKFDSQTAKIYNTHVKQHIPNYNHIVNKAVACCTDLCDINDKIIDFGSATGYTLDQLYNAGFRNLVGVETSRDMIDVCDKTRAEYFLTMPNTTASAIIANWALHFNQDKLQLIELFFNSLKTNGFLFLSEKTIQSEYVKSRYYDFKKIQGVSWEEIKIKEQELTGIMYIDSVEWYFKSLKSVGFKNIDVIDASEGFVTMIGFK